MIYRFGGVELDTEAHELRHGGTPVPVEPQVFDLLRHLVEHRDRLVSREELFEGVWQGRFVSEASLLLDPLSASGVPAGLADLAHRMRHRTEPGDMLVRLTPKMPSGAHTATIVSEGIVQDHLSLDRHYDHIDVPGPMGTTTLRLHDGRLSVVRASCRHKTCQKMAGGSGLICVPNRLVVTLPFAPSGLDGVTG